jgi:lysophospholipase L1-like esterase
MEKRSDNMSRYLIGIALLLGIGFSALGQPKATINVTFFGSSVCYGTGAEKNHGYAWQFFHSGTIDTTRFRYFNASTGGDNTLKVEKEDRLSKKLYPTNPDIVVLGLSLGNEGILTPKDDNGREQILEQYRSRLVARGDSLNSLGIQPVIVNCYANNNFGAAHYAATQRMNRLINTWPYPSVNVLGTIDDLTGKWVEGYWNDALHPNTAGHREMSYALVPSLFEAIRLGKKTPAYDWHQSYVTLRNKNKVEKPLLLNLTSTVHSFTLSFRFKEAAEGTLAGFVANDQRQAIDIAGSAIHYKNLSKSYPKEPQTWTHVVFSHSYANQKTSLFVNGELVGSVAEQLAPTQVFFGGTSTSLDLKDIALHRAALNESEALDLFNKKFIQSSLEFYNPLTQAATGDELSNHAQSLTRLKIDKEVSLKPNRIE